MNFIRLELILGYFVEKLRVQIAIYQLWQVLINFEIQIQASTN